MDPINEPLLSFPPQRNCSLSKVLLVTPIFLATLLCFCFAAFLVLSPATVTVDLCTNSPDPASCHAIVADAVLTSPDAHPSRPAQAVDELPSWVPSADRALLEGSRAVQADVVVAKDGSGKYNTVQAAVDAAPDRGKRRYVIYVKKGVYKENLAVWKKKRELMIVGDGMDATVITGSRNVVDGATTFNSATLAVAADGVILQDLRIENTAGPEKHQAVALRVSAARAVINRCRVDGYQDTLYAHQLRQFYRDCFVSGTVDFVFGNAAAVLQNCAYSRTVYMQSYLGAHVHPRGWLEWNGDFALNTLFYGEYANEGPGAGTAGRVKWPGYRVITDGSVAEQFTVGQFIQGGYWLKGTGVAYDDGL
uniref:Pectinesterase n=1 Tax=Aegilops tauschii TaxID=37682 RepID=R7W7H2_AEGTA